MPDTRDFLRRFRRVASPPGRAGSATVPVDHLAELSVELAEVFVAMDEIDEQIEAVEREAREDAERIRGEGRAAAERVLAEAEERAELERSEAAASRRRTRQEEISSSLARAEQEAREITERADARIEAGVARVLDALMGAANLPAPD